MRSGAARVLMVLLIAAASAVGANADMAAKSFPFSMEDNRIFVGVTLNGQGPFSFLLDTGSSSETVTKTLADKLHLKGVGQGATDGAGESKASYETVHLDSLALGGISFGAMDVPALDVGGLSRAIGFQHFDGVLGADLFLHRVVVIDAREKRLIAADTAYAPAPGECDLRVPIELNGDQMPVVAGSISGIAGRFLIDTGDRSSLTLFGPFWRAHRLDQHIGKTVTAMTGYGIGGPIMGIVGRPDSFQIDGITVPAPVTRLSLQKAGVFTSSDYAGSIGMGVLKRFLVTLDYNRKVMWLRPNANFHYPDSYDRSGLWLGLDENGLVRVLDVVKDGPAARAGIREADIVTGINGKKATAGNLFQLRAVLQDPGQASAEFELQRAGIPRSSHVVLHDLISPPSP